MKAKITFIQYYAYETKGKTEEECFEKAYQLFKNDMYSSIANAFYDEVEEEYEDEEESEGNEKL